MVDGRAKAGVDLGEKTDDQCRKKAPSPFALNASVRWLRSTIAVSACMTCNIWWSLTGGGAVKLSVKDLAALHAIRRSAK
jgi:hypothetical protein